MSSWQLKFSSTEKVVMISMGQVVLAPTPSVPTHAPKEGFFTELHLCLRLPSPSPCLALSYTQLIILGGQPLGHFCPLKASCLLCLLCFPKPLPSPPRHFYAKWNRIDCGQIYQVLWNGSIIRMRANNAVGLPRNTSICYLSINLFIKRNWFLFWKLITEVVLRILISTIYQQEILLFLYTALHSRAIIYWNKPEKGAAYN